MRGFDADVLANSAINWDLALAIAEALAEQVAQCDGAVVQVDEANLPGAPDEWEWAAAAINRVLDGVRSAFWLRAGICMRTSLSLILSQYPREAAIDSDTAFDWGASEGRKLGDDRTQRSSGSAAEEHGASAN